MTRGWALTLDSLCLLDGDVAKIIPYESWVDYELEYEKIFTSESEFYGDRDILKFLRQMSILFRASKQ